MMMTNFNLLEGDEQVILPKFTIPGLSFQKNCLLMNKLLWIETSQYYNGKQNKIIHVNFITNGDGEW